MRCIGLRSRSRDAMQISGRQTVDGASDNDGPTASGTGTTFPITPRPARHHIGEGIMMPSDLSRRAVMDIVVWLRRPRPRRI